jgi:TatD DNase family protein
VLNAAREPQEAAAIIDSHAHVTSRQFDADREAVLQRAFANGVRMIVNVGCDVQSSLDAIRLAAEDVRLYATVGIHPHEAARATEDDWRLIEELVRADRVVAVGECGFDRGPHNDAPLPLQEGLLRLHVALARETGLPLVIHNRETYPELFAVLEEEAAKAPLAGVMHCFSGGPAEARRSLELGFYLSFSGVVTFKNAREMQDAARVTPLDRILVETDCPYLTPHPHRGKRNEPAYVRHTADFLADLLGVGREEMERTTERNTLRAFRLPEEVLA